MDGWICVRLLESFSAVDLFNRQWMMIVCHGLKVHIVIYTQRYEILWEEAPLLYVAKRSDVLVVPSTVLKLKSKQQTSLNKRRRVGNSYVAWVRVGGTLESGECAERGVGCCRWRSEVTSRAA